MVKLALRIFYLFHNIFKIPFLAIFRSSSKMEPHPIWLLLSLSAINLCVAFDLQGSKPSYAKFSRWEPCQNGSLSFEFMTDRPNALLLYTHGGNDYDFLELKLVLGTLKMRLDLGGGAIVMSAGHDLNDMEWHKVDVVRKDQHTKLIVDSILHVQFTKVLESNLGPLRESYVFVGGMPVEYGAKLDRLALPSVIFEPQFKGSIQNIQYSNCGGPLEVPEMLASNGIRTTDQDLCLEKNPCLNGGTCLTLEDGIACECTGTNFEGEWCENEKAPLEITFSGNEYLTYDLSSRGDAFTSSTDQLDMYFKTRHSSGLLFYTGDAGEYFNVALRDGGVILTVNLGSGIYETKIEVPEQRFDDNRWHHLVVTRESREITFMIDHMKKIGTTIGKFTMLSSKVLFVGGSLNTPGLPGSRVDQNFKGCMKKVYYRADSIELDLIELGKSNHDLIDVIGNIQFDKCHIHIDPQPITFTTPDSYIILPKWNVSKGGNISFKFQTNEPSGLILYNSRRKSHKDFFGLEILDGCMQLIFNVGSGTQKRQVTKYRVDNGAVHNVTINISRSGGFIKVDNKKTNYVFIPKSQHLRHHGKMYLGGVGAKSETTILPKEMWAGMLGYGFVGCVKDFFVNGEPFDLVSISKEQKRTGIEENCKQKDGQCVNQPCLHEGLCRVGWNRFICDCRRTSYYGPMCEHVASTLNFDGTQYMKITMPEESETEVENIALQFNTIRPHGLLFLTASEETRDIMEILLESGSVKLTLNLGSGTRTLTTGQGLNNGQWHIVFVKRRAHHVQLSVDNNAVVSDNLPEPDRTLKYKFIYIGSIGPLPSEELPGTASVLEFRSVEIGKVPVGERNTVQGYASFVGRMRQLYFNNNHFFELAKSGQVKNIEVTAQFNGGAISIRDPVTFKQLSSYAELPQLQVHLLFVISFKFRTTESNGLLLYNAGRGQDFMAIELFGGKLYYVYNIGNGPRQIKAVSPGLLNDNQWHKVSVWRHEQSSQLLRIDDNPKEMTHIEDGNAIHFDLEGPLYLGGVKKTMYHSLARSINSRRGFQGCIGSLELNNIFPNVIRDALYIHGSVVDNCVGPSRECHPEACMNHGQCVQQWNSYSCNCDMTSFSGNTCSEESTTYEFGDDNGLIVYTYPEKKRTDRRMDSFAMGIRTIQTDAVIIRVESRDSDDYLEVELVDGNVFVVYNMGTADHPVGEVYHRINDGRYHVIRFNRSGPNSTIQVDNYKPQPKHPDVTSWFTGEITDPGQQMSVFNDQAHIYIGGKKDTKRPGIQKPYHGVVSGFVFNGISILDLVAEKHPSITVEGSLRKLKQKLSVKTPNTEIQEMQSTMGMRHTTPHQGVSDDIIFSGVGPGCHSEDDDDCSPEGSGIVDDIITSTVIIRTTPRPAITPSKERVTGPVPPLSPIPPCQNPEKCPDRSSGTNFDGVNWFPPTYGPNGRPITGRSTDSSLLDSDVNVNGASKGESYDTTSDELNIGLIVGIAAAVLLALIVLIIALYKFQSREEGSYKIDESQNFAYLDSTKQHSNGALLPHNNSGSSKGGKKKDVKEWYV